MNIPTQIPSVNFHLWKPCNMKCRFCFATFQDIGQEALPKGHLPRRGLPSGGRGTGHGRIR